MGGTDRWAGWSLFLRDGGMEQQVGVQQIGFRSCVGGRTNGLFLSGGGMD